MSKFVKEMEIGQLRKDFAAVDDVVVVNVVGMNSLDTYKLRTELHKKKIELHVVKNSLARMVLGERGMKGASPIFTGPCAVAYGGDSIVEVAKEIVDWAKKFKKLEVKGACVSGQAVDPAGVDSLSKMPSRMELLGRIVMLAQAPGARLISLLNGPGGQLAGQIKTKAEESKGAPSEESAVAPAAAAAPAA